VIDVAFVIGRLNIGGAEAELVRLARGLDRTRFRPFVVTLQDAGPLAADLGDVELVALNRPKHRPGTCQERGRNPQPQDSGGKQQHKGDDSNRREE
jgi:hypothetical protein